MNDTKYCNGICDDCGNSTQLIYCFEIENISKEYTTDEVRTTYNDFNDCLESAREDLKCYINENDLFQATIYEEKHKLGDIMGEPIDIYTISSKNEQETKEIREAHGYCRLDVDEYLK